MKLVIDVSPENESTSAPWWVIVDPVLLTELDICRSADMVTGPFFSRAAAQAHLDDTSYNFSKRAVVYCKSGYQSAAYKVAYEAAEKAEAAGQATDFNNRYCGAAFKRADLGGVDSNCGRDKGHDGEHSWHHDSARRGGA